MNKVSRRSGETSYAADPRGASHFVASLDSASLPDMGDRSLDQETHAYVKPRRRNAAGGAPTTVRRRSGLPFPEPRFADMRIANPSAPPNSNRIDLRQLEENAGLAFIRPSTPAAVSPPISPKQAVQSHSIQVAAATGQPIFSRVGCSGPTVVVPPKAVHSFVVATPAFDVERVAKSPRRVAPKSPSATLPLVEAKPAARFASLEGGIAKMSEHASARIAVLAIGVGGGILGKVQRLADVLRDSYSRRVEVLAAENPHGLALAPRLGGDRAGEVLLISCAASEPQRMIPALGSFDGVILMVEIGETPVDDAAAWADALRRKAIPIVGVWAA